MWRSSHGDPSHDRDRRIEGAARIMIDFVERTGLTSRVPPRRYLWTDAFAVCNLFGLARATGQSQYLDLALALVDAVHGELAHHRRDDSRSGWLSGLFGQAGSSHPTAAGLRIGKKLPERNPHESYDARLEWQRDGQYFHYLTKWMHALDQASRFTEDSRFNVWARELARVAHGAFVRESAEGAPVHMYWKMSIDLTRPLVPQMGQHDPLDGFITGLELQHTAAGLSEAPVEPRVDRIITRFAALVDLGRLTTFDPLGLGGLLIDACRLAQLGPARHPRCREFLEASLDAAIRGLAGFGGTGLGLGPEDRLAFRELGLSIGLRGLREITRHLGRDDALSARLERLRTHLPLAEVIESFWNDPNHQGARSWSGHEDINAVMLATSLIPDGFLLLTRRGS